MELGRLFVDEQVEASRGILNRNAVLAGASELRLPGWYLTAGCVFQTVWNVVTGRPATEAPRRVYETTTARWREQWPTLTMLPRP